MFNKKDDDDPVEETVKVVPQGDTEADVIAGPVPTGDTVAPGQADDTPEQPPTDVNADLPEEKTEHGGDPTDPAVVREEGPVGTPHWQALVDLHRILPCEVLPVNTTTWKTAVDVVRDDNSDQLVIITDKGERLYEREVRTPVLCRTTNPDSNLLH